MTFLFKKTYIKALLLSLCIFASANAVEFRPLVQFDFSTSICPKVNVRKQIKDVKEEQEYDSDFLIIGGAELLFSAEFAPIHYGFGLGFKSEQKQDRSTITPAFLPIWGSFSFGFYHKENWSLIPYTVVRAGPMLAMTGKGSWWESPFHFFIDAGVGLNLPYNFGVEVNYGYSSVQKSFEHKDTKIRIASGRLGIQLSIGLQLTRDRKIHL